jgi:hypothetical protein
MRDLADLPAIIRTGVMVLCVTMRLVLPREVWRHLRSQSSAGTEVSKTGWGMKVNGLVGLRAGYVHVLRRVIACILGVMMLRELLALEPLVVVEPFHFAEVLRRGDTGIRSKAAPLR